MGRPPVKPILFVIGALIGLFIVSQFLVGGMLGYMFHAVDSDEVGVKFVQNQPVEVLGPGIYTDYGIGNLGQFKRITTINVSALPFQMNDEEVLTADKQRIGVVVTGTVRRPGVTDPQILLANWSTYRQFYQDDGLLAGQVTGTSKEPRTTPGLMQQLGSQAAKVCIGDSNFDDAVIGSARDLLRECIEKELSGLAGSYGLTVSNIVVPNIALSKPVQDQLDSITQARLATQLAAQREQQASAEAKQEAAKQQGAILVEQGKVQEKARQDANTAQLQTSALQAQRAQIEAEKNNALYTAQRDQEIAEAQRQAALLKAQADLAPEVTKAQMYQSNPAYTELQKTQAMAGAYKNTDKVLVLPEGSNPVTVLGDSGRQTIVQPVPANGTAPTP